VATKQQPLLGVPVTKAWAPDPPDGRCVGCQKPLGTDVVIPDAHTDEDAGTFTADELAHAWHPRCAERAGARLREDPADADDEDGDSEDEED
jgi:hypothetical protein